MENGVDRQQGFHWMEAGMKRSTLGVPGQQTPYRVYFRNALSRLVWRTQLSLRQVFDGLEGPDLTALCAVVVRRRVSAKTKSCRL